MLRSPRLFGSLLLVMLSAGADAAISASTYVLERSRQAVELEGFAIRLSVRISESSLALGAASTGVLEDPRGGLHPVTTELTGSWVTVRGEAPLSAAGDAAGVWKLTLNEGLGVDEILHFHVPAPDAVNFPVYPSFPQHPFRGVANQMQFVWTMNSASVDVGVGATYATASAMTSVYTYPAPGLRSVSVSHLQSVTGATITAPDGAPRGPVVTQNFESKSRMEVFPDGESRELAGETTVEDGVLEFLASGLVKGSRYAILGRTGEGPWEEIHRFTAVSNAHVYAEEQGDEERSFTVEADPNRAPTADGQVLAVTEDTPLPFTLTGSDPDEDELSFEIVTPPAKGVIEVSESGWTYVPDENATGADEFTIRADDGAERFALSEEAVVTVFISPVNDVPVANEAEFFTMKGGTIAFTLPGSDLDGDALTYQVQGAPAKGKLSGVAPNLSYKAAKAGEWTFNYTVSDGSAVSTPGTITLSVRSTNQKPVAQPGTVTANIGEATLLPLTALDADHDAITYSIKKKPKNGVLTGIPPMVSYRANPGFRGSDSVSFIANDGGANSKPAVIQILVVNPNNRAPEANFIVAPGPVKKVLPIVLAGTDADGDAITYRVTSQPANGKLTGKAPNLKFKPAAGFSGTTSFTYVTNDGSLDSEPATVTVAIGVPLAPP